MGITGSEVVRGLLTTKNDIKEPKEFVNIGGRHSERLVKDR